MFNRDGGKVRRQMQPLVDKINALEPQMQSLDDEQLKAKTDELKQRHQGGETLDALLVESFAVRWHAGMGLLSNEIVHCICCKPCEHDYRMHCSTKHGPWHVKIFLVMGVMFVFVLT